MPDGTSSESPVLTHDEAFVDFDDYHTCLAGRKRNRNNAEDSFFGMVYEVSLFSCPISLADIQSRVYYTCDYPCPICLTSMLPTCRETIDNAYIGRWDFTSADYQTTSLDRGPNDLHFSLIDNQASYDPIYVHNQGLYFDGTSHIRTANTWTQGDQFSFTYEGWIRPTDAALSGDLLEFEITPGQFDSSIGFNGNNVNINFQGTTLDIPITYTNVNEWHYVGISVQKIDPNLSRVCVVFGPNAESCANITAVLANDAGGNTIQVGNNFKGMIKDFTLYDWAKRDYEFTTMYQTTGCTAFNGVACTM